LFLYFSFFSSTAHAEFEVLRRNGDTLSLDVACAAISLKKSKWTFATVLGWKPQKAHVIVCELYLCVILFYFFFALLLLRGGVFSIFFHLLFVVKRGTKFMCDPSRAFPRANVLRRAPRRTLLKTIPEHETRPFPVQRIIYHPADDVKLQKKCFTFFFLLRPIIPVQRLCCRTHYTQ